MLLRAIALSLALLTAAGAAAPAWAEPAQARERLNARVFDAVWNTTRRAYYDPTLHGLDWAAARDLYRSRALAAEDEAALYVVVNEMLDELDDPHAAAISPSAVRNRERSRTTRAVMGLSLAPEGAAWRIEDVRAGSPADEARLERGWLLKTLDGAPWNPDRVLEDGRPVELVLADAAGVERRLSVTPRVMAPVPAYRLEWADHDTAVARIAGFEPGLGDWLGATLDALPEGSDLVLDLRGNPGGRLMEAEAVLACFLPRDLNWAVRRGRAGRDETMRIEGGCGDRVEPADIDLAVLVSGESRSAAELTPAALQEAGRAVIVGEQTPGVVLIAQDATLPDGGRLSLSRMDFATIGGVRLEKRGVTPDVMAATTLDDRRAGRDPGLEAAMAALDGRRLARAGAEGQ